MSHQTLRQNSEQLMAVMNFAGLRLAVPLAEVHSLSSVLDLDDSQANASILAQVEVNGRELPAFGFDAELSPLHSVPDDYRVCVNLGAATAELGILCQSIETLEQTVSEEALPACLSTVSSMVKGLALHNEEVLLCSHFSALVAHIAAAEQVGAGALLSAGEAS